MFGVVKQFVRSSPNNLLVRHYRGGVPGCNLPFRKSIENPTRFAVFFLVAGVIGFGAPWLVVMHQMLRPYDYP